MAHTKEYYIYFHIDFVRKVEGDLSDKIFVDAADGLASLAVAVYEGDFRLRVVMKNPDEFSGGQRPVVEDATVDRPR